MEYGLIAEHLSHSFSKNIHEMFGLYEYELHELPESDLDKFLKDRDFKGINVTIPYKEKVIPYLDSIDPVAERIGAVNVIVNKKGKLKGYNTDYFGLKQLILRNKMDLKGKNVLIFGTGGTSKTAFCVATDLGAARITKVSRSESPDTVTYKTAATLTDTDYIINTTPVGMYPNCDAIPMDITCFKNLQGVVDCIFNPFNTDLVIKAREMGVKATGGLYMLVIQAVEACKLFTGTGITKEVAKKVYKDIKLQKSTIALIGLPTSGKTTMGKQLAGELGLEFLDTDDLIVKKDGRAIPDIFAADGEAFFRKLETEVIKEASLQPGTVIATGGGCIKTPENMAALKRSGIVIFLNRDLKNLMASSSRPLSNSEDKLKLLYEERFPLYMKYADYVVDLKKWSKNNLSGLRRTVDAY